MSATPIDAAIETTEKQTSNDENLHTTLIRSIITSFEGYLIGYTIHIKYTDFAYEYPRILLQLAM